MKDRFSNPDGFSLVEVILALGITAFCLLAVIGLLPDGLKINQSAFQQTAAVNILSAVIADLRNTPASKSHSAQFNIPVTGSTSPIFVDGGGQLSTTDKRFRIMTTSTDPPDNGVLWLRVTISWPGMAETNPQGSVDAFVVLSPN